MRDIEKTLEYKIRHLLNKNNAVYERIIIEKIPAFTQTLHDPFIDLDYEESFDTSYLIWIKCDLNLLPNNIFRKFSNFELDIEKRHGFHVDIVTYLMESDVFSEYGC